MKAASCVQQLCFADDHGGQSFRCHNLVKDNISWSGLDALHTNERDVRSSVPNPLKDRVPSSVGVSFNLRKRTHQDSKARNLGVSMSSYNSAFLSGLFADIANANVTHEVEDASFDCDFPVKRSRLTLSKSISRCGKSYIDLGEIRSTASNASHDASVIAHPAGRTDSLSYQLHCVSSASSNESEDIGKIAFPYLPATVSDSSCAHPAKLTRRHSGQPRYETENNNTGESYGWFVSVDDDDDSTVVPIPADANSPSSLCDLAFSAATAPKRSNFEAEVEWAKAADTVDDVLGDFF